MECLLPYLNMVTVPHIMVGLERMLDYRDIGLERFHCIHTYSMYVCRCADQILQPTVHTKTMGFK